VDQAEDPENYSLTRHFQADKGCKALFDLQGRKLRESIDSDAYDAQFVPPLRFCVRNIHHPHTTQTSAIVLVDSFCNTSYSAHPTHTINPSCETGLDRPKRLLEEWRNVLRKLPCQQKIFSERRSA
jgi:hypothetical protein